jgi:hypothetical protein
MIHLAADQDWLHKATKEISKYWRNKRERHINPLDVKAGFGPAPASNQIVFSESSVPSMQKTQPALPVSGASRFKQGS